ncbi:pilus assembly PilX N-terminal domain-containing protein [Gracilibacillus caseinilyticus]|uniref:Pilus assembly PilX N-terminal domain-containing protein n=1 Tax=Gracilibacillus caseinilyticus TaxID=2932256 RepID=A0ABY4ES77_9BACI|nr:pilus assembly PilX N-terminal domain-containing protein [Gracilibacillus caseinilyticus]UOQ47287.1 pilus assembly PilX N-terminal domain-containing protein [Gracilibacillus caseinilyticus]
MDKRRVQFANEKGIALVLVMMVFVILSLLSIAILTVSASNLNVTTKDRSLQSSFYIAETGLNHTIADIYDQVDALYHTSSNQVSFFQRLEDLIIKTDQPVELSFTEQYEREPKVKVTVTRLNNNNPRAYHIVATGGMDKSSRTVETEIEIEWQDNQTIDIPQNLVAYTGVFDSQRCKAPQIALEQGAIIDGDFGTACLSKGAITITGNPKLSGEQVFVPEGAKENVIDLRANYAGNIPLLTFQNNVIYPGNIRQMMDSFPSVPSYTIPVDQTIGDEFNRHQVIQNGNLNITHYKADGYQLKMTSNLSFHQINFNSNRKLYIDTNGQDREITVERLNLENGHIYITGEGALTVYVTESITFGSGSTFNADRSVDDLFLYLAGKNKSFTLTGAQKMNGHLFAEDASVTLSGGGGFNGSIITGGNQVNLSGGNYNETLILAPHAKVTASNGASVYGTVISDSLRVTGGAKLSFKELNLDDILIFGGTGDTTIPQEAYKTGQTLESQ